MWRIEEASVIEVPLETDETQELHEPIPINGWEDYEGEENRNPPGQECFKQKYFVEEIDHEVIQKCDMVEDEKCGLYTNTKYTSSQVTFVLQLIS